MPKRFIDSDIFKDDFTRSLKHPYKSFWIYLFCDCANTGIWEVDFDVASIRCDGVVKKEIAEEIFTGKYEKLNGSKWFLPGYIEFQYGFLCIENSAQRKIVEQLLKLGKIEWSHKKIEKGRENNYFKLKTNNDLRYDLTPDLTKVMVEVKKEETNEATKTEEVAELENDDRKKFLDLKDKFLSDANWISDMTYKYVISSDDLKIIVEEFFITKTGNGEYKQILTEQACQRNLFFYPKFSDHYKKIKNINNVKSSINTPNSTRPKVFTPGKRSPGVL